MFLSGDNFNKICTISIYDWHYYNKYIKHNKIKNIIFVNKENKEILKNINNKSQIFFTKIETLGYFIEKILPILKKKFILVTHNGDYSSGINKTLLEHPLLIKWLGQNMTKQHNKTEGIPIGLENSYWNRVDFTYIKNNFNVEKTELLYLNFNLSTNKERKKIIDSFIKKGIKRNDKLPWKKYIADLAKHKFCISPKGNGIDCHRTWECLYLGVIPIVIKSNPINYFNDLPILFVNDFDNITEDYLLEVYNTNFKNKKFNLEKLKIEYWEKKITELLV